MLGSLQQKTAGMVSSSRPKLLGRLGKFETRLAGNASERKSAQALRYKVFCEEMSAQKKLLNRIRKREQDIFDRHCDHLVVIDSAISENNGVIGTQRFLIGSGQSGDATFYSQQEFDVSSMMALHPSLTFMELGRSCILPEYRGKRTMELMWQGTWAYAVENSVDVMFGCASFEATDCQEISAELGFLSKFAGVTEEWDVSAVSADAIDLIPFQEDLEDQKKALRKLPPLIKGYLRLGAMFSNHAVPDPEFGTIDVLVVLPVARINPRYVSYYGEDASKHRA